MAGELDRQQPTGGEEGGSTHAAGSTMEIGGDSPLVSYNPEAPSEEWGWHGSWEEFAPRGSTLILLLGVFTILAMVLLGNHVSNTENWWMIAFAIGMSVWMIRRASAAKRERARRP